MKVWRALTLSLGVFQSRGVDGDIVGSTKRPRILQARLICQVRTTLSVPHEVNTEASKHQHVQLLNFDCVTNSFQLC